MPLTPVELLPVAMVSGHTACDGNIIIGKQSSVKGEYTCGQAGCHCVWFDSSPELI